MVVSHSRQQGCEVGLADGGVDKIGDVPVSLGQCDLSGNLRNGILVTEQDDFALGSKAAEDLCLTEAIL